MSGETIVAGKIPATFRVPLTDGSDYYFIWQREDGTAPAAGDTFKYEWANGTVWTATVSGVDIVFSVDYTVADTIPAQHGVRFTRTTGAGFNETIAIGTAERYPRPS